MKGEVNLIEIRRFLLSQSLILHFILELEFHASVCLSSSDFRPSANSAFKIMFHFTSKLLFKPKSMCERHKYFIFNN